MTEKLGVAAALCVSLVMALAATAAAQTVVHVDADAAAGANDGSSWADAYTDLQDALNDASLAPGDEIWVAEGRYKPTTGSDRTISFQLVAGVALYGGFGGTEVARDERDWTVHETILSGDLLGDDDPAYPPGDPLRMNGENSYHVVIGADDATLDGFTVANGNADGGGWLGTGGGMYNDGIAGATVANCTFSDNAAGGGGGIANRQCSPAVTACTFTGNSADSSGGGMANSLSSSPAVTDCMFSDNTATYGGGIHNGESSPTVTGCMFWGNTATDSGGGVRNYDASSPVVTGCMFLANEAYYGGGIDSYYNGCSPTVSECTFSANTAFHGGGMRNDRSSPAVTDCTFAGNLANYGGGIYNSLVPTADIGGCVFLGNAAGPSPYGWGGAIRNRDSFPTVVGCEFSWNTAMHGGAMANAGVSSPDVLDCAFSENAAGAYGGAMLNEDSSSPFVSRCSFVGNTAEHGGGVALGTDPWGGSATIASCLFSANRALASSGEGGGILHASDEPASVTNCTLVGNSAGTGGGIDSSTSASCAVTGCILWGNRASTGPEAWGSSCTVSYSRISQTGGYTDAGGNIRLDPEFVNPGHWDDKGTPGDESDDFWVDGDYHLLSGSPCIDRADGDAAPATDIEGSPRHDDPGMPNFGRGSPKYADIGAYEFQGRSRITPFAGGCAPSTGSLASLALCLLVPCLALRQRRRLGYVPGME